MRTPDHIKLRSIMLNHFEKGWTAAQSFRDLTNTYGEGTIGESTVELELDDDALLEAVEQDENTLPECLERSLGSTIQPLFDIFYNLEKFVVSIKFREKMERNRLKEAIQMKRPRKKNHIIFHHDNAKLHVREDVVEFIEENLPHPPYSSDAAATDFYVNLSISNSMQGEIFDDFYDMVNSVKDADGDYVQ
uniref:Mos1 transposase HTH domain-containing protein n=1 Tax=Acrobeloides nanus TaxID=290746 RepID=A0A914C7L9_9BILA